MDRWRCLRAVVPTVMLAASWSAHSAQASQDLFDIELNQLEQIVVTAQKRKQSIDDVPISIAAVSGLQITQRAVTNLQTLSAYIPNVTINEAVIDNNLFIRGVGSGVNSGFERSVGTYIDGVYAGRSELSRLPFLDIERIEVLKGPQSTLFGKNTIAGALNITTVPPSAEVERQVQAYFDPQHSDARTQAILSGGITDQLSGRIAASYQYASGDFEHALVNEDAVEKDHRLVRGQLRWQPSSTLVTTLKLEHANFENDGRNKIITAANPPSDFGPFVSKNKLISGFREGAEEFHHVRSDLASLTINYDFGPYRFTSITGYLDYATDQKIDALNSPYFVAPGDMAFFTVDTDEDFSQISQEFRFASPLESRLSYLAGAYAQLTKLTIDRDLVWPVGGTTQRYSHQEGSSAALFGQVGWQANKRWRVSVAARYNSEEKDFKRRQSSSPEVPASITEDVAPFKLDRRTQKVTGALQLQYSPAANAMTYLSISTGFKDGGFDESQGRAPIGTETLRDLYEFDEETVRAIELGAKYKSAREDLALHIAAFRSEYDDLQTSVFDGIAGFSVANAASSVTQGIEIDLRWLATPQLKIQASAAYLDTSYEKFPNGACSQWHAVNTTACDGLSRDLGGDSLPFAPELSASMNVEYNKALTSRLSATIALDTLYTDEHYTASDLDPLTRQKSYTRFDLRLALADAEKRWELAILGKNLSNEFIATWRNDITFSNVNGRRNTYSGLVEQPRTVAVQGRLRF